MWNYISGTDTITPLIASTSNTATIQGSQFTATSTTASNFPYASSTALSLTTLHISNDAIQDFAGTGLTVSSNALTADLGTSVDLTTEVSGILPVTNGGTGASTLNNLITLSTHTTGNYVATVADAGNSTISVSGSGSEGAAVTLDAVDLNCTDCINATEIADIYLLNSGDTTTGSLTFSGVATDITTAGSEDFTLTPGNNGNIILQPTGVGQIEMQANVDMNGFGYVSSLLPGSDATYDIGSSSVGWSNIYLSNNGGIYFNNTLLNFYNGTTYSINPNGANVDFVLESDTLNILSMDAGTNITTLLGAWNYGGATSIEMVNGTNPTLDVVGEFGLDTTANQFLVATSTASPAVWMPFHTKGFEYGSSSWNGTKNIGIKDTVWAPLVVQAVACSMNTGTSSILVSDGSNESNSGEIGTATTTISFSSNNSFNQNEQLRFEVFSEAASSQTINCMYRYVYTRQ